MPCGTTTPCHRPHRPTRPLGSCMSTRPRWTPSSYTVLHRCSCRPGHHPSVILSALPRTPSRHSKEFNLQRKHRFSTSAGIHARKYSLQRAIPRPAIPRLTGVGGPPLRSAHRLKNPRPTRAGIQQSQAGTSTQGCQICPLRHQSRSPHPPSPKPMHHLLRWSGSKPSWWLPLRM